MLCGRKLFPEPGTREIYVDAVAGCQVEFGGNRAHFDTSIFDGTPPDSGSTLGVGLEVLGDCFFRGIEDNRPIWT